MRILSFWRFTPTVTLTFASAETAALIPLRLGTDEVAIAYGENSRLISGFLRLSPFEVVRCRLCGSRGTHRKCSRLKAGNGDWACGDCTRATDGRGLIDSPASRVKLCSPPQRSQRRSRLSKRHLTPPPHISSKRYTPRGKRTLCVFAPASRGRCRHLHYCPLVI